MVAPLERPLGDQLGRERVIQLRRVRPTRTLPSASMTDDAIERARKRLEEAAEGRPDAAAVDAALERARAQVEELAQAAAPTAGLHFTPDLLGRLDVERVTLHVGLDTFRPVAVESLAEHELHSERYEVERAAWEQIRTAALVLAVGTTTVRVLETLARGAPLEGRTELFVLPGFDFRRVDALLTNFHLPRSTLLALVMAFAGVEETRRLYRLAIEERYRFYSFGDAMLVL